MDRRLYWRVATESFTELQAHASRCIAKRAVKRLFEGRLIGFFNNFAFFLFFLVKKYSEASVLSRICCLGLLHYSGVLTFPSFEKRRDGCRM